MAEQKVARQKFVSGKPIIYQISGIKGFKGLRGYIAVIEAIEAQLGRTPEHTYDGRQGVVVVTSNVESDTSRLSKDGLTVHAFQ